MAEKRRGLGRGLGSLIPSQEPGRPSDVFFPRGERSADVTTAEEAAKERGSSDPAESMRRAQAGRRTAAAKRSSTRSGSSGKSSERADAETVPASTDAGKKSDVPAQSATSSGAAKSPRAVKSSGNTSTPAKSAAQKKATGTSKASAGSGKSSPQARGGANANGGAKATATSKTTTRAKANTAGSTSSGATKSTTKASANTDVPAQASSSVPDDIASTTADTTTDNDIKTQAPSIPDSKRPVQQTSFDKPPSADVGGRTVDGVYVSRETVLTQSSAQPVTETVSSVGGDDDVQREDANAQGTAADDHSGDDHREADVTVSHETSTADPHGEDFDELVPVPGTTFGEIDLEQIRPNPRQPRDVFDEDALDELITSIREIGVLQPVVVRRRPEKPGHYELIMGERRFRASKEAGKTTIPAIVRATADDDLLRDALLENLHRVDLNPLEEAAAYAQLLEDFSCTQEELSARIGRSRPQISNTIRLLRLPAMVQRRVAAGVLSSGHARALLGLNDGANMEVLAQRVVAEGLSVRATEEAVVLLNRGERVTVSRGTREADPELAELARSLGDRLDTRVNVVMGKRKGKLSVEFANGEDLGRILALLGLDPTSPVE